MESCWTGWRPADSSHDGYQALTRNGLGEPVFRALLAEGRAMTTEEAIAGALAA